jgi:serine protease Do
MNSVRDIITSIIDKGYFERVYIGVSVYSEAEVRGHRGGETSQNLIVESVEKGSPAEDAGIQAGDIITEVNGEKVTAYSDLTSVISKSKAGDVVTLTVSRGAETLKIEVTLGVRQQTALPAKDSN